MQYQGVIWEEGKLAGRIILFPIGSGICIGSEEWAEPDILIRDKQEENGTENRAENERKDG